MSDNVEFLSFLNPETTERIRKVFTPLPFPLLFTTDSDEVRGEGFTVPSLRRHPLVPLPIQRVEIHGVRKIPTPPALTSISFTARSISPPHRVAVHSVRPFAKPTTTSRYWRDAGWHERDGTLIGYYRAPDGKYHGTIVLNDSTYTPFDFFIYDPPHALLHGRHSACFHFRGKVEDLTKYWVHWSEPPHDVDSGIVQIEQDLAEALGKKH